LKKNSVPTVGRGIEKWSNERVETRLIPSKKLTTWHWVQVVAEKTMTMEKKDSERERFKQNQKIEGAKLREGLKRKKPKKLG